ncbi:MAG: ABC transporter substrate-binding protein, partial [Spirochaetota bacterium]
KILKRTPKPDGAIFCVAFGQTIPLLDVSEKLEIPVFIQGPLFQSELEQIGGRPRKKYKSWIGYFYDNEEKKSAILAKTLIADATGNKAFASDGTLHVIGIGGDRTWFGSALREKGLRHAAGRIPSVILHQVVPTMWSPAEARAKATVLMKRYPETSVIWAASDQLAVGASAAAVKSGKTPGRNVFIGGVDLSPEGLQAVQDGTIQATVSGLLTGYAEILVYLHDYIHGIDFAKKKGIVIESAVYSATRHNAAEFQSLYGSVDSINFKRFSRVYNSHARYDFSLQTLRKSIAEH